MTETDPATIENYKAEYKRCMASMLTPYLTHTEVLEAIAEVNAASDRLVRAGQGEWVAEFIRKGPPTL